MRDIIGWLMNVPNYRFVPLFDTNDRLEVATRISQPSGRRLLCRNPKMEEAIIEIVETGLSQRTWEGLFYVMGFGELPNFRPLYVGKAERKGVTRPVSENIRNIRKNKHMFARWGDGLDYHIGDLSHTLFRFKGYREPTKKFERWTEALFVSRDPPILREPVHLYLAPWLRGSNGPSGLPSSLPAVKKELIALASVQSKDTLLNVDGV